MDARTDRPLRAPLTRIKLQHLNVTHLRVCGASLAERVCVCVCDYAAVNLLTCAMNTLCMQMYDARALAHAAAMGTSTWVSVCVRIRAQSTNQGRRV